MAVELKHKLIFDPPELGCVLYLSGLPGGGGTINDRSPYGNHGAISGASWRRLPSGLWYLDFDGVDDEVQIPDSASLSFGNKTQSGSSLYENYITGDGFGHFFNNTNWKAQTFTPAVAHTIASVKLKLYYDTTQPGTITVSIRATDGSGHPTGADLASGTLAGTDLTTTPGIFHEITFTTPYSLSANVLYAIVIRTSGSISGFWRFNGTGAYAGGNRESSGDSGASWTADVTVDYMFEEWGTTGISADSPFSVEAWINRDDALSDRDIVTKIRGSTLLMEWYMIIDENANFIFCMVDNNTLPITNTIYAYNNTNFVWADYVGKWVQVGGTYNGSGQASGLDVFLNGENKTSGRTMEGVYVGMYNTAEPVRVGYGYAHGVFGGGIALPRIWNRRLTAFEFQQHFQREKHLFGVW